MRAVEILSPKPCPSMVGFDIFERWRKELLLVREEIKNKIKKVYLFKGCACCGIGTGWEQEIDEPISNSCSL